MSEVTIFEQDGKGYTTISHSLPAKELAKNTAKEIRYMPKIPRAKMRVVAIEEFRTLPWASKPKIGLPSLTSAARRNNNLIAAGPSKAR